MKKLFPLLFIATLYSCSADLTSKSKSDTSKKDETFWRYSDSKDEMTSKENHYADLPSDNAIRFIRYNKYQRSALSTLYIRKQDGEDGVILEVVNGQFITGEAMVRFDNKKLITFETSAPEDGSNNQVFITPAKKFIRLLKKSKKVLIQTEFYQNGSKIIEFTPAGFKWPY